MSDAARARRPRWDQRVRVVLQNRAPQLRDALAVAAAVALSFPQLLSLQGPQHWWVVAIDIAVSAAASVALWWRRRAPVLITLIGILAYAIANQGVPLAIALATTAVRRRDRVLLALTALAYVTFVVRGTDSQGNWVGAAISGILLFGALVAGGAYIGARRDLVATLRERAERAEEERELRVDQARLSERTRIAQEMHDVLAHKVSLVALHAGALEVNPGAGPEQVERTAALVRTTAHEALEDLRQVLGVLRSADGVGPGDATLAPQPGLDALESLVASSRAAGVAVELEVDLATGVPDLVGRTAYRVVQEALTNVHKHARGAATCVRVVGGPGRGLEVSVTNRPPVSAGSMLPGWGLGLVGLSERVSLAGGELSCGPEPDGGWQVCARLPWPSGEGAA